MTDVKEIFNNARPRQYKKGQILIHQGDPVRSIYYIKAGYVKIYLITAEGEERILHILGPGEAFPIIPNLKPYNTYHFYETMTPVELCYMDRKTFVNIIRSHPKIAYSVLEYYFERATNLTGRLHILEGSNALEKVESVFRYLMHVCCETPKLGWSKLLLKLTHQDIANMTGLTRETVSIQMKKLQDDKVIKNKDGLILLKASHFTEEGDI